MVSKTGKSSKHRVGNGLVVGVNGRVRHYSTPVAKEVFNILDGMSEARDGGLNARPGLKNLRLNRYVNLRGHRCCSFLTGLFGRGDASCKRRSARMFLMLLFPCRGHLALVKAGGLWPIEHKIGPSTKIYRSRNGRSDVEHSGKNPTRI